MIASPVHGIVHGRAGFSEVSDSRAQTLAVASLVATAGISQTVLVKLIDQRPLHVRAAVLEGRTVFDDRALVFRPLVAVWEGLQRKIENLTRIIATAAVCGMFSVCLHRKREQDRERLGRTLQAASSRRNHLLKTLLRESTDRRGRLG